MRFLADMGMSQRVVTWLTEQGHDAVYLRDQGLQRLEDEGIVAKAVQEARIILTLDLDFAEILALSGRQNVSAVIFRLHNTRSVHVIRRLALQRHLIFSYVLSSICPSHDGHTELDHHGWEPS
jgi:predicted nuclease of predicted toxin-antitoxin system